MNDQQRVAEERLKNAVQRLADLSSGRLRHLIKGVGDDVASSVRAISHEVVSGIQDIKAELSVASAVRRMPLPCLAGAAVVGATVGVAFGRANSGANKPGSSWPLLLVDAGLALLKANRGDGGAE